jgi:hypothetical protein
VHGVEATGKILFTDAANQLLPVEEVDPDHTRLFVRG